MVGRQFINCMNSLYVYPKLERVEKNNMRFYIDSLGAPVPSVTTVLDATGDKSGINEFPINGIGFTNGGPGVPV